MAIIGAVLLLAVFALVRTGSFLLLVCAAIYAFLTIRIEEGCILDFLRCAAAFLLFRQQRFLWEGPHE